MVTFIRICAWFSFVIFIGMALAGVGIAKSEGYTPTSMLTVVLCLITAWTGWNARRAGLRNFTPFRFSKIFAILTILIGILFNILVPIFFLTFLSGNDNLATSIRNIWILFIPPCVSAFAILFQDKLRLADD